MKKMKQKKMRKIGIASALGLVVLVMLGLYGASNYMLNYSLNYPKEERMTAEHWKNRMKNECPWMIGWMDSVYQHHCVKDTFVVMPSGYKAHAIYLYAPKTTEKTAVVVHGYQVRSEGMLHIAYLYNHDMGYNVLLPDLYGHGESEGDHIQMGWKDRWDVIRWSEIANEIFRLKGEEQRVKGEDRRAKNTLQVIHGISMGASTTMAVSGEKTPDYVKCFVEDCGYTSVWDVFSSELQLRFGLPEFPILYTASGVAKLRAGYNFTEASALQQVAACEKPMLFIHGTADDFIPYEMMDILYNAKPGDNKAELTADGAGHGEAVYALGDVYWDAVFDFVAPYMQ